MDHNDLLIVAERFKQGLLAKATNGEYSDKEYKSDFKALMDDQRISKMIPSIIRASRTADDFRRAMQAKYQHYAIVENLSMKKWLPFSNIWMI